MNLGFWRATSVARTRAPSILRNCRLAAGIPFAQGLRGVGNKIQATARKRMAARKTPQGEPRTTTRPVNLQRIGGIVRTGRIELAGARHQRGKKRLVHAHRDQQRARSPAQLFGAMLRNRRTSSASRGAKGACATERRG